MKLRATSDELDTLSAKYDKLYPYEVNGSYKDAFRDAERFHQPKVDKLMRIVQTLRDGLIMSGTDISNAMAWTSAYSVGFVRQSIDRTNACIAEVDKMLKELNETK